MSKSWAATETGLALTDAVPFDDSPAAVRVDGYLPGEPRPMGQLGGRPIPIEAVAVSMGGDKKALPPSYPKNFPRDERLAGFKTAELRREIEFRVCAVVGVWINHTFYRLCAPNAANSDGEVVVSE